MLHPWSRQYSHWQLTYVSYWAEIEAIIRNRSYSLSWTFTVFKSVPSSRLPPIITVIWGNIVTWLDLGSNLLMILGLRVDTSTTRPTIHNTKELISTISKAFLFLTDTWCVSVDTHWDAVTNTWPSIVLILPIDVSEALCVFPCKERDIYFI